MIKKKSNKSYQFKANEYPLDNGFRIIEASAGTGKTFSLAHLVLRLLTESEYDISQILVVSFTNATASEIKSRITKRVIKALHLIEQKNVSSNDHFIDNVLKEWCKKNYSNLNKGMHLASLLLKALENIDKADITTIHGFCNKSLKREALECGAIFKPTIQSNNCELIREVTNEYWKSHILDLNPEHIKGLKKAGFNLEKLSEALLKIDNEASLELKNSPSELNESEDLANQFNYIFSRYWEDFVNAWREDGDLLDYELIQIAKHLKSQGIKDTKPYSSKPRKNRAEQISQWIENYTLTKPTESLDYPPAYVDIRNQKELLADYYHPQNLYDLLIRTGNNDLSIRSYKLQEKIAKLWDGPVEFVWNHSLSATFKLLKKRRIENGIITNGDLLKGLDPRTKDSKGQRIKSKKELFQKLRKRYKAILVDEFQDTDPVQWRILKQAFGESKDHLLLMVGDPKQAIYQFRGGDLNTYLNAREEADRIDILSENYRATPRLMKSINQLMSQGLTRSYLDIPNLKASSSEIPLPQNSNEIPIELLYVEDLEDARSKKETKLIAKGKLEEIIPNIISNHLLEILNLYSEQLQPSDLCILVQTHKQAAIVKESLEKSDLPCRIINKGDVLKTEAALILQTFMNCLASPADSGFLKKIACSPLLQWSIDKIKGAERNGELDELAMKFRYWKKNLEKLGIIGCISELVESNTIADLSNRGRLYADLNQCSEILQEEIHRQGLNAESAAKWLRKNRLNPPVDLPSNRQQNSDVEESAINIITIHQSKGLQFKLVLCPYLWQSPTNPKGPLWRDEVKNEWYVSVNNRWDKNLNIKQQAKEEALQEAERLAYVALTRACKYLIIIWGRAQNQEGNPLTSLLFGPESINCKMEELTKQRMEEWITSNSVDININYVSQTSIKRSWLRRKEQDGLSTGPVPTRTLVSSWGRYSYSSWVRNPKNHQTDLQEIEEGKDRDEYENEINFISKLQNKISSRDNSDNTPIGYKDNPLKDFPRGAFAGECLHKILERINFQSSIDINENYQLIQEELNRSGIDPKHLEDVQKAIKRVLNIPISGPLAQLRLRDIRPNQRIHEMSFDLPLSHEGGDISSLGLSKVFKIDQNARFGRSYAKQISDLRITSKGFLTGSIDLIFADQENHSEARWWVVDWKSNWIGKKTEGITSCGPANYDEEAMERQMLHHNYPLQAHLYLVAMHRLLKWRLPQYNPEKHLGGYIYIFLRGIPEEHELKALKVSSTLPGLFVEKAPVKRLLALNDLLDKGEI